MIRVIREFNGKVSNLKDMQTRLQPIIDALTDQDQMVCYEATLFAICLGADFRCMLRILEELIICLDEDYLEQDEHVSLLWQRIWDHPRLESM